MKAGYTVALAAVLLAYGFTAPARSSAAQSKRKWLDRFDVKRADLLPTGANPYITMQPGRVLKFRSGADSLTVTVLPDTQDVDGVRTGVLEERETKNGKLVEVSRNFLATDKNTGDVYYFGEDVDNYKNGKIVSHDSAWRAGAAGARFGLMIPATPIVGQAFYQEIAPTVAMDRVEVMSIDDTVKTPAGTFERCVHLRETTPLERGVSHKYYAPGVGLIKDDGFELTERPGTVASAQLLADIGFGRLRDRQLRLEWRDARLQRIGLPDQIADARVAVVVRMHAHP